MSQNVIVVGNLGQTPELRMTTNGTPVLNGSLASNRKVGDKEEATWYEFALFGPDAEHYASIFVKGMRVTVYGFLEVSQYEHKGEVRIRRRLIVYAIGWLPLRENDEHGQSNGDGQTYSNGQASAGCPAGTTTRQPMQHESGPVGTDDDPWGGEDDPFGDQ